MAGAQSSVLTPYKVLDVAYPFPIKVRELLDGKSGAVSGVLTTDPPTGEDGPTWFYSQVTPFSVHAGVVMMTRTASVFEPFSATLVCL